MFKRDKAHRLGDAYAHYGWFPMWKRKQLPGYGSAQQYAFETLDLAPHSPISGAIHAPEHLMAMQAPQIVAVQTLPVTTIAWQGGTFALTPLYDPSANLGSTK